MERPHTRGLLETNTVNNSLSKQCERQQHFTLIIEASTSKPEDRENGICMTEVENIQKEQKF